MECHGYFPDLSRAVLRSASVGAVLGTDGGAGGGALGHVGAGIHHWCRHTRAALSGARSVGTQSAALLRPRATAQGQ